ncbi:hypothetical protein [Acetobacter syzygii]|uniref:hypothetical protein n=1 Tax=Acetobacter syzygii TaxID=146476 RepID=UPI00156E1619|nr:hypothetical protein [Acetobacter syzygii]NSL93100.1 hypothetical protein [Acetobacter syzygii]
MGNLYTYGIHKNLIPAELFVYIAIDEIGKGLGIHDVEAVAAIFLGQNNIAIRGKFKGATKGTSVASIIARSALPYSIKYRILPAFTGVPFINWKYILTKNWLFFWAICTLCRCCYHFLRRIKNCL